MKRRRKPDPRADAIAKGQTRVVRGAAIALVVFGVLSFVTGTVFLLASDELSVWMLGCMEVGGVASLLLGLKKLRDLREDDS